MSLSNRGTVRLKTLKQNGDTKMTSKEIKQQSQDALLQSMTLAFYETDMTDKQRSVMSKQLERVEKLFGYTAGSWSRG